MIEARASATFEATLEGAPAGLAGVIGVRIVDVDTTVLARSTAGIAEYPAGAGIYSVELPAPALAGDYRVLWDTVPGGAPLTPDDVFAEDLRVYAGAIPGAPAPAGLLATLEQLKRRIRTEGTVSAAAAGGPGALDETLLLEMLEAASDRMRDARPERTLVPTPALDTDPPVELRFPLARTVQVPDLRQAVEVRVDDGAPLASSDYTLRRRRPEDPALWVRLKQHVDCYGDELVIVGRWGPSAVKPAVRDACLTWTARAVHQRTARFADNQQTPDGGVLGYFRNLPPDVKLVLDTLWVPGA